MSIQVKKKQTLKGVRLGWTPLKEVRPVKLTPGLLAGEKITADNVTNEDSFRSANSYLIP